MRRKVLTAFEARQVEKLGRTMFPKGGAIRLDAVDARVVDYVDTYLTWMPADQQKLIRVLFLFFGLTTPSDEARRKACLLGWETSNLMPRRLIFQALRSVLTLAYTADPEVLRQMGVEDGSDILHRMRRDLDRHEARRGHVRDLAANEARQ